MGRNVLFLGVMVLALAMVLVGCGTSNGNNGDDPISDPNDNQTTVDNDPNDGRTENHENNKNNENNANAKNEQNNEPNNDQGNDGANSTGELITKTGIYNGQADPHTIEIETEEGPLAFQLTMEARDDIDALTEGGEVTYTYTEDGDRRTIESIQMTE